MPENHDEHEHRNLDVTEAPLDAANQSLADALRASFGILKAIMMILVILYLFSNVRTIGTHEEALRLRLGRLQPGVKQAGLTWAFPFPIDEILTLPTKKSNEVIIDSHTFHRRENEQGKPLSFILRNINEGLHPTLDGALLTADGGLVHVQWKITYKIDDVSSFASQLEGNRVEVAEEIIRTFVETVGISVASELNAEEIIRTRVDHVKREMRRRLNERLATIKSGIDVTLVELHEPTPPPQIRDAFDNTQRAENWKEQRIREAQRERTETLSEAAGASYKRLIEVLDDVDAGPTARRSLEEAQAELDRMLENEVEGEAGRRIKEAGAYLSSVVGQIQSDVELYRTLLPEYRRNSAGLIARLWEETKQRIYDRPGVVKFYRPLEAQTRIHIGLDPDQERLREERRLLEQEFDVSKLRPKRPVPLGPEAG